MLSKPRSTKKLSNSQHLEKSLSCCQSRKIYTRNLWFSFPMYLFLFFLNIVSPKRHLLRMYGKLNTQVHSVLTIKSVSVGILSLQCVNVKNQKFFRNYNVHIVRIVFKISCLSLRNPSEILLKSYRKIYFRNCLLVFTHGICTLL